MGEVADPMDWTEEVLLFSPPPNPLHQGGGFIKSSPSLVEGVGAKRRGKGENIHPHPTLPRKGGGSIMLLSSVGRKIAMGIYGCLLIRGPHSFV